MIALLAGGFELGIQNVTLSLPRGLLRRVKVLAARRETSISRLMTDLLEELIAREDDYEGAARRHKALLRRGFDMGTQGRATWSREELHDRSL